MKTIDLPSVSKDIASLLDQAGEDDLVVRLADGREFLLVAIDEFDLEVARTRANPKLMKLLDARVQQTKLVPLDEVKRRFSA
ncbi:MAG: hypothetical protein ABR964_15855 [Tepidisphaeraceae bacterium]|jgi:predicted nucleic acid-binding protein